MPARARACPWAQGRARERSRARPRLPARPPSARARAVAVGFKQEAGPRKTHELSEKEKAHRKEYLAEAKADRASTVEEQVFCALPLIIMESLVSSSPWTAPL